MGVTKEDKALFEVNNAKAYVDVAISHINRALHLLPESNISSLTAGVIHDGLVDMKSAMNILKRQINNIKNNQS